MRTVGLKVLKNKLAEYVRIAAAGERVLISDRDRVVAGAGAARAGPRRPWSPTRCWPGWCGRE